MLKPLEQADLLQMYLRAKSDLGGVSFADEALVALAGLADGDARRFLLLLERIAACAKQAGHGEVVREFVERMTGEVLRRFDNAGDSAFDQLSAFQKSIRGSHPDAALYWAARLLDGGFAPEALLRRLVVIASEDIGKADPRALQVAVAAAQAFDRTGTPEGYLPLAQAVTYLASAPKSNAAYAAWKSVWSLVKRDRSREVPLHLRNAPTELAQALGHKKGYQYPHDEPEGFAAGVDYLPSGLEDQRWYRPTTRGAEAAAAARMEHWRELDLRARGAPKN